jgi:hypothetical protein
VGRTVASITQEIEREESSWGSYRRALRREDRELLDALFCAARHQSAACAAAGRALPLEAVLLSMLIETQRALRLLEARLASVEGAPRPADPSCPSSG